MGSHLLREKQIKLLYNCFSLLYLIFSYLVKLARILTMFCTLCIRLLPRRRNITNSLRPRSYSLSLPDHHNYLSD